MAVKVVSRDRSTVERLLPLAHFAIAVLLVAVLLPSALRPPRTDPPDTPQLSPDAPPDATESIIAAFGRGTSSSAGADADGGLGEEPGSQQDDEDVPEGEGADPPRQPRACPYGYGDPPRQVESVYSPPCAPTFVGDNGGATSPGVTPTEIRVALTVLGNQSHTRRVPDEAQPDESPADRTTRVYMTYLNSRFQFYGRRLVFYTVKYGTEARQTQYAAGDDVEARNTGKQMVENAKPFAAQVVHNNPSLMDELLKARAVTFGGYQLPGPYLEKNFPYAWGWNIDGTRLSNIGAEYVCTKLAGRKASFAGDEVSAGVQNFRSQTRKFGIVYVDSQFLPGPAGPQMIRRIKELCDVDIAASVAYDPMSADKGAQQIASAMNQMKDSGVTTVLNLATVEDSRTLTTNATSQVYYPEWVVFGQYEIDQPASGQVMDQAQWAHAFGISSGEFPQEDKNTDWYRAYMEIDPDNTPHKGTGKFVFYDLFQLASAIQRAGPNLTPQTLAKGLFDAGRRSPVPVWSVGGGYGPSDYTFADDVAEMWWDGAAYNPMNPQRSGAYRFTNGGRRFGLGQVPSDDSQLFRSGQSTPPPA